MLETNDQAVDLSGEKNAIQPRIPESLGAISLPDAVKETYIYIQKGTQQLVIEYFANSFDSDPIPVD